MKYIVIDRVKYDEFVREFDSKEDAIKWAKGDWDYMCAADKKCRDEYYVLESVNPDEEAEDHFDGNVVWDAFDEEELG